MNDTITNITINTFTPQYKHAFSQLNKEWISHFFAMEAGDYIILDNPEEYILDRGGEIFAALEDDEVLGVCAMVPCQLPGYDYELAKMAVSPKAQGKGIGFLLGKTAIQWATEKNASAIFLDSNTKLTAAIQLYRKLGFIEVTGIASPYHRTDIQMALTL